MLQLVPVVLFLLVFKWTQDPLTATAVLIASTTLSVLCQRLLFGEVAQTEIVTLYLVWGLGGLTLLFHEPIYVQWKHTITFTLFALIIVGNRIWQKSPMTQRLLGSKITVPASIWQWADTLIMHFCLLLAIANTVIIYWFSFDTWINFKLATIAMSLLGSVALALYLVQHAQTVELS